MKFSAFARLTRIEHAFMLCIAVLIAEIVALGHFPEIGLMLLTFIPPFLIEISSFAINDYRDVETDRLNGYNDRPLVSGEIKPQDARDIAILSAVIGVAAAFFINWQCFVIAFAFSAVSFLYSYVLKDWPLIGNAYVAFTMAIPFIFGSLAVVGDVSSAIMLLALISFVVGLGREIMGTVRDLEGDKLRNGLTFPMLVGPQAALIVAAFCCGIAIALSLIPFASISLYMNDLGYLFFIILCDLVLVVAVLRSLGDVKYLKQARNLTLFATCLGLVAFLVGALL